ncbi:PIN domain-containing protein [Streptomyces sp. NPDC048210]|uniref:PIN domain-containing protein n=1 Tax=Streptomyces sp. NPDC048210 TaxID=3156657 RepID=UPI00341AF85F
MIILDANIVKGTSLRGPVADVLRAIRAAGVERVATPWIAVEEVAAQQALLYAEKHQAAIDAVNNLRKATPWGNVDHPKRFRAEYVRDHWRERYASITEVLETPHSAYQEALFREANQIAPCKVIDSGSYKTGARDAAIWLTAVEYAKAREDETVYFVSSDSDMSKGGQLHPEMQRDIRGMEDRFHFFTSLDGVVTKFATEVEATADDVSALLATEESRVAILGAVRRASKRYGRIDGAVLATDNERQLLRFSLARPYWFPQAVALDKVLEVSGREVGGNHWFTAWVRWLLTEDQTLGGEVREMGYAWETRVLLSTAADQPLTVLDFRRPDPIRFEDIPHMPAPTNPMEALVASVGKAQADSLMRIPAMRAHLTSILDSPGADVVTREVVFRRLMDGAASRGLSEEFAENIANLPDEADDKE